MLRKILLSFLAADLIMIAVVVMVYGSLHNLEQQTIYSTETIQPFRQAAMDSSNLVNQTNRLIAASFLAQTTEDIEDIRAQANYSLEELDQSIAKLKEPHYISLQDVRLSVPDELINSNDLNAQQPQTVSELITAIEDGKEVFAATATRALNLSTITLKLRKDEEKLKKTLSKQFRKTLELQPVNDKLYNRLARGVIALTYSNSLMTTMNVAGPQFAKGHKAMLEHCQANGLDEMVTHLNDLKATFDETYGKVRERIAASGDFKIINAQAQALVGLVNRLDSLASERANHVAAQVVQEAQATISKLIILASAGVVLATTFGVVIALRITRPVRQTIEDLRGIAKDDNTFDLTKRIEVKAKDEIGQLVNWLNRFITRIHDTVEQVDAAAQTVTAASSQIAKSSHKTAGGMQEQSERVAQIASVVDGMSENMQEHSAQVTSIAAAVDQMSGSVVEVARKSAEVADTAADAGMLAQQGGMVVEKTINDMKAISDVVTEGAASVSELGKKSEHIGQIISVINEIADQTNLLALNAAIEAARAGEHGRGFAVVADEVRKLADRTTQATDQISKSIQAIQQDTALAVTRMQTGTETVVSGVSRATEAGASLKQIVDSAQNVATLIQSIAAAAEQQSTTSEMVTQSVQSISSSAKQQTESSAHVRESVDAVTQVSSQVLELAQHSSNSANNLSDNAQQLKDLMAVFKTTMGQHS